VTTPVVIDSFKGLRVASDPYEVGPNAAIDGLNFDVSQAGILKPRNGSYAFQRNAAWQIPRVIRALGSQSSTGPAVLVSTSNSAGTTQQTISMSRDSTILNTQAFYSTDFAACGTAGTIYCCHTSRRLRSINPTTGVISAADIAGSPLCTFLCHVPVSDRLCAGIAGSFSRVEFSAAGNGASWSGDFVDLDPADGQMIQAIVAFNEELYVFKETKFFIFGRESLTSAGTPIHNYRTVNVGVGCMRPNGACVGPNGVYFVHSDGIYVTAGGPPAKVSGALDGIFGSGLNQSFTGLTGSYSGGLIGLYNAATLGGFQAGTANQPGMAVLMDRLFVAADAGTFDWTLVMDTTTGEWMPWKFSEGCGPMAGFYDDDQPGSAPRLLYGYQHLTGTGNGIGLWFENSYVGLLDYEKNSGATAADVNAVTWYYTGGALTNNGSPVKARALRVTGLNADRVSYQVTGITSGAPFAPQTPYNGLVRNGVRDPVGVTWIAYQAPVVATELARASTDNPLAVDRLTLHLTGARDAR
jgi:hypothetical protein